EATSTGMNVRHEGAATTVTSLDTRHASSNINKTPSMPHDLSLPRVHTLGSDEGRMQHNELMDLVTKLSDRVVALETDLKQIKKVYGATYTKLIMKVKKLEKAMKTSQARRKAKIVVFDDEEDLEDPSKQGRKIEEIDQDPNISLIHHDADPTTYHTTRKFLLLRKKLVLLSQFPLLVQQLLLLVLMLVMPVLQEEFLLLMTLLWQTLVYIRRSEAKDKEERNKYSKVDQEKMLVDLIYQRKSYFAAQKAEAKRNKPMTQAQQRTYMSNYIKHIGSHTLQQLRIYSFDELEVERGVTKKSLIKGVLRVPVEEVYVKALQEKYPIIDWERYMHDPLTWRLYDTCGVHHVFAKKGMDIFMLVEKEYPLSKGILTLMSVNKLGGTRPRDDHGPGAHFKFRKYYTCPIAGASINLMPLSVWKKLMLPELKPTRMTLELANRSFAYPVGIAEDVFVQVGQKYKSNLLNHKDAWAVLRKHSKWDAPDPAPVYLTEGENVPDEHVPAVNTEELFDLDARPCLPSKQRPAKKDFEMAKEKERTITCLEELRFLALSTKDLSDDDAYYINLQKAAIKEKLRLQMPRHSNNNDDNNDDDDETKDDDPTPFSDPIVASLSPSLTPFEDSGFLLEETDAFLALVDSTPPEIENEIYDSEGDILFLEKLLNRMVNLKIHEVIKAEVIKLLDARLIYPISDSPRVSLVHVGPKKGGAENLAADHLSRLENPHKGDLIEMEMNDNFPHESLNMIALNHDNEPSWFADIANYLVGNVLIKGMSSQQKKKTFKDI
nr:reverse transcriptase domain-containing protein [Tanacetum cinerariifolium]